MTMRRTLTVCAVLLLVGIGSPATAGDYWHHGRHAYWRATHHAIYERENLIALLEANPETDDGYKAPIITRSRAEIRRLRATLPRSQWRWTSPCCYSRRSLYIR